MIKRSSIYNAFLSKVSKVDSSKADSFNVRGVAAFFDTCLNLGRLFLHNFKIMSKIMSFCYCIELFETFFKIYLKFLSYILGLLGHTNS